MNTHKHRFIARWRFPGIQIMLAMLAVFTLLPPQTADAQRIYRSQLADKVVIESGPASLVAEKVRAAAAGVLVEVFVRSGESVKKGQILGHLELPATKYQLDLARQALANEAALNAAKSHADAWQATRTETEDAVRKRKVEKTRLEWATDMAEWQVTDDPKAAGRKIITLLVNQNDLPSSSGGNLSGSKFDVLLPDAGSGANETGDPRGNIPPAGSHPPVAPADV
jgi:pyruvate/2-oxoglutarate dehydrogenase complex dihydrolipoamide acyltransferase (E2) component